MNATLLHRCYNRTGEAATWMPGLECLLWVDIDNGILYQYTPDEGTVKEHTFPEMITSVIPWKGHGDEVLLAMKNRFIAYDLEKKTYKTLIEFPCLHPQWRTNDCKASPEGRIWCGVMHCSEHNGNGSLYCVDNDLSLTPVLGQQSIPNGIVWNRKGDRMYYGEFYQFNLSSCIRQQNSLTAQFVSFSLANLANIFYPPDFYNN